MSSLPEDFDKLVNKLEKFAVKNPKIYQLQVALLAVLGYVYIFSILGLLFGSVIFLIKLILINLKYVGNQVGIIKFFGGGIVVVLLLIYTVIKALWVRLGKPLGLELKRSENYELFQLVDELTLALQAPKFNRILLIDEFNAAVVQVPRLGVLGFYENFLLLGLPLMQAVSLEELKATIAHELGHLSSKHSRFHGWIYRVRRTWWQLLEQLEEAQSKNSQYWQESVANVIGMIVFQWFFNWYIPCFTAYSFVLARANEYEADRLAAKLVGKENIAKALINIEVKGQFISAYFHPEINKKVLHEMEPPAFFDELAIALKANIPIPKLEQWLQQALAQKTNTADTHPCLKDRLQALKFNVNQASSLIVPPVENAAEKLLGKILPKIQKKFNIDWQENVKFFWRERYQKMQDFREKLIEIDQKAGIENLTIEESWQRIVYTIELQDWPKAIDLLKEILGANPDHIYANYTLGKILLASPSNALENEELGQNANKELSQNYRDGLAYLEKSMGKNLKIFRQGSQIIYQFWLAQGQGIKAHKYLHKTQELIKKAEQERQNFSRSATFKSHGLTREDLSKFSEMLTTYPRIKTAYLVQKLLKYFPDDIFYVCGLECEFLRNKNEEYYLLVDRFCQEFFLSGELYLFNIEDNKSLGQMIKQQPGSLIYQGRK